jgi:hypothetical protein
MHTYSMDSPEYDYDCEIIAFWGRSKKDLIVEIFKMNKKHWSHSFWSAGGTLLSTLLEIYVNSTGTGCLEIGDKSGLRKIIMNICLTKEFIKLPLKCLSQSDIENL